MRKGQLKVKVGRLKVKVGRLKVKEQTKVKG